MNRAIKKIKLIILLFISNVALAAHDNKDKADDKVKQSETKLAESKLDDYLSQVTNIPDLKNIIKDYANPWANVTTLTAHTSSVNALTYSPNNKFLASTGGDGIIKIWDTTSYKLLHTIIAHTSSVNALTYSPDNKFLISGSSDGIIKIWNVNKGYNIHHLLDNGIYHNNWITSLAYSSNNRYLASGNLDGVVKVWDAYYAEYKLLYNLTNTSSVTSVAYSPDYAKATSGRPDNKHLAAGNADNTIKIWNVENNYEPLLSLTDHTSAVTSVAYSPDYAKATSGRSDNKYLASGSSDGTIKIWAVNDNYKLLHNLTGHTAYVYSVIYSPDNKYLASGDLSGIIKIWDAATYELLQILNSDSHYRSLSFNHNGKYLACGEKNGNIQIWHHEGIE